MNTDQKLKSKIKVFVSSVQKELGPERAAVSQVIAVDPFLEKHCEAILFENEPTPGRPQKKPYLDTLKECELYVLIVDVEYGGFDGKLSATHEEYREAQNRKMPTAVFIRGLDGAKDRKREKSTQDFIDEIKSDAHKYKRFHDREDLKPAMREALLSILKNQFQITPTKAEDSDSEHQIEKASGFELTAIEDLTVDRLDKAAVSDLIEAVIEPASRNLDNAGEQALAMRGLAIRRPEKPSIVNRAACLLFHPHPATRFPQCEILADAYEEPRISGRPKGQQTINAPLLEAVRQALAFIDKHSFHPRRVVGLNNVRLDEYPQKALREVLINALAHRDYEDATRKIILRLFSDRVEVASPGYPLKPLTIAKLEKGNYRPCSRNPLISQTLALMDQMEQRGTGFARMRDAMLDHGLDAPDLSRADGYFIVTLPGPNGDYDRIRVTGDVVGPVTPSIEKQLTERQRKMVSLLIEGEELTSRDCEARFGVTRPVIAKDFRKLLELGLVERIGSGRSTRYRAQPGKESLSNR